MRRTTEHFLGLLIFITLLVGVATLFIGFFAPTAHIGVGRVGRHADISALQEALSPTSVDAQLSRILAFGSRVPSQPGLSATADLIRKTYAEAGLEVYEQDVEFATVLTDGGAGVLRLVGDATEFAVYPLAPNYVQPVVTPPSGVSGELVVISKEGMEAAESFEGKIAVIDLARPDVHEIGIEPALFAELGFEAILYTHAEGVEAIISSDLRRLFFEFFPANVVRVVVAPDVLALEGQVATLTVQAKWRNTRTRNIIGRLRASEPVDSALVIPVYYDALSLIPDLAPGTYHALQTAIMLQVVEGLRGHESVLKRDVIFVAATGANSEQLGMSRVVSTLGKAGKSKVAGERISTELAEQIQAKSDLEEMLRLFDDPSFSTPEGLESSRTALDGISAEAQKRFADQFNTLMRMRVFRYAETLLEAEIAFKRNPDVLDGPAYPAFRQTKKQYDEYNTLSSLSFIRFLSRPQAKESRFFCAPETLALDPEAENSLRSALRGRFRMLLDFHESCIASLNRDTALHALFSTYTNLIVVSPAFNPDVRRTAVETVGFTSGTRVKHGAAAQAFHRLLEDADRRCGGDRGLIIRAPNRLNSFTSELSTEAFRMAANAWMLTAHPTFSIISPASSYTDVVDRPFHVAPDLTALKRAFSVFGEAILACASGEGNFQRLSLGIPVGYQGKVFAAGVGTSLIPNFPVAGALIATGSKPPMFTDPYGAFKVDWVVRRAEGTYPFRGSLQAYCFDTNGCITYVKDFGAAASLIYKSERTSYTARNNIIVYRAAPVAIFDFVNPQSMKAFTDATFITREGLNSFPSTSPFISLVGLMDFIPPEKHFFVTLRAGSAENELVSVVRAFCLGTTLTNRVAYTPDPDAEIDGPGYLAYDTPVLRNVSREASASMAALASERLDLQTRFGMADEMTLAFHDRALETMNEAEADASSAGSRRGFHEALAYLILNQPVIHGAISEAIWGILWYMALIVPFMFFFEKLVFGFTDIRKQLLAQGLIFLTVFLLLRLLHPAFQIVRSSLMILLGFVIILIAGSATILLSAKFQENIDALRRSQGAVKNAEGNRFGMMATAFMLGLNNMHRRKVRTGLTCASLVLMTFVMICFSSVQSNVVNRNRAVGKALYQGLLIRTPRFTPITLREIQALKERYGHAYPISIRAMMPGTYDPDTKRTVPVELAVTAGEGDQAVMRKARAALLFDAAEPLAPAMPLLTTNGWFTAAQQNIAEGAMPIILSDRMAERLRISIASVNAGQPPVSINGRPFFVQGIFDSSLFARIRDVDEENLLPFDIEALVSPRIQEINIILADAADPRVAAEDIILVLNGHLAPTDPSGIRTVSAVVDMQAADYPTARREINAYLEQTSRQTCYGLDGIGYIARRARIRSLGGLIDLIIPLIIAGLTVLNTMKGSVYERRGEIFVYNAVGIAPRHVFFMFVAEALVYAVVGIMLGYVLAQGTGRILTELNLTGGLNMNFTSLSTVYASLAIAAATVLSTWFPARSAMEIAKPADDSGWRLPTPEGDALSFNLPFTFGRRDRIAVLGFFHTYFINHGEGSSGPFSAAKPKLGIREATDAIEKDAYVPAIAVTIWCKPYDLGVSQRIQIALETDPETGEYISKMTLNRLTGTRDAWLRLNGPLVTRIRQHFLHWRAASEDMKEEFFVKAKALIEETVNRTTEDETNG